MIVAHHAYNSRSTSPGTVVATSTAQSAFYGPIEFVGRVENFVSPSTELFEPAPRSALRQELAVSKEQRTAVVTDRGGFATLAPNVGPRLSGQNMDSGWPLSTADGASRHLSTTPEPEGGDRTTGIPDEFHLATGRSVNEPLSVRTDSAACGRKGDQPQTAPASWMAAITARVNSLWNSFYGGSSLFMPALNMADGDCGKTAQPSHVGFPSLEETGTSFVRQEASVFPVDTVCQERRETQPPNR